MKKVKIKTIQLSEVTWKKLAQIKLDSGSSNFDEVVKSLIDYKGGY